MKRHHITAYRTDGVTRLPTGGIAVPATLCSVGVLEYETPTGSRRELRGTDAVCDPASVRSLIGATVVVFHPSEREGRRVTPDNYQRHVVGTVAEAWVEGDQVEGIIHVHDAAAVRAILGRELSEISPGYDVALVDEAGEDPVHGAYDARTERIEYNHVALLPPGTNRQGSHVALRLDAAGEPVLDLHAMDPEEIKALVAEMVPSTDDLVTAVSEAVAAKLPDLISAEVAAALASQAPASEDPAVDADLPEEDPAVDADLPAPAEEDPPVTDEDTPMEERLDSRLLEIVRAVERVTGAPADMSLSAAAMLRAAATSAGIEIRTDSADRLLGALEGRAAGGSGWRQDDAPEPVPFVSSDSHAARIAAERSARSMARG